MLLDLLTVFVLYLVSAVTSGTVPLKNDFELHIVHLNDFHARFEETSNISSACRENCIAGFSRIYALVHQLKQQNPHAIVLNGGDNFQGTLWYNIYKWNVTQHFLNQLPTDAYTLGNHEFDDNIDGVVPFLDALKTPVVVVNIDDSEEPAIQGKYKKSVVLERQGKRIGVIGVILATTDQIANPGKLKFFDEVKSVNAEAERLVKEENVDTIIVLSHCGYDIEKKIALNASPKIGLIVGAHSHTFLYTGQNPPGVQKPGGPYPTVVKRPDGRTTLVVQAAAFGKFVGNITIKYDKNGNVISWDGAPIYLDEQIPQDNQMNEQLATWKRGITEVGAEILGSSKVFLDQSNCRYTECNIGNFLAESMIYAYLNTDEKNCWTSAAIAVLNTGGIRSSIANGNITFNDLVIVQPFGNTYDIGEIQGTYIKDMLEFAAKPYNNQRIQVHMNLLQLSGIRVVYNISNPIGARVVSVKVRCRECLVPSYENLNLEKTYRIVMNSFMANGGDGYKVLKNNLKNQKIGPLDVDVLREYIKLYSPIITPLDERIQVVN